MVIEQMSRQEKWCLLETLWEDVSSGDADVASPAWHFDELRATERRVAAGEEKSLPWEIAKNLLRSRVA